MHNSLRGVPVPDSGDDLLASYEKSFDAAGIVVPVASVAAARTILARAEADNVPATPAHPFYFDMNGIFYRATGVKNDRGAYILQVMNEATVYTNQAGPAIQGTWELEIGKWKALVEAVVPTAPYDRMYLCTGTAWCRIINGSLDLEIYTRITDRSTTYKAHVNGQDDDNTSVTAAGIIKAGEKPDITMWFKSVLDATQANNKFAKFQLSSDDWTRMTIMTWPISMA
nr:MAG TPA: hypothetical protein [Caudoviricetes sp.]